MTMGRVLDDDEIDEDAYFDDEEPDLGPDERDADILDGSWEQQYYTRRQPRRGDWEAVKVGVGLLIIIALVAPLLLVVFR